MGLKNIGRTLSSVIAGIFLAATVTAGEIKKPVEEAPSQEYAVTASAGEAKPKGDVSLGVVVGSISNGASIDTLAEGETRVGFDVSMRFPFGEGKYGIRVLVTPGYDCRGSTWIQASGGLSAIRKGLEVYLTQGVMFEGVDPSATLDFGTRYHVGNIFYVETRFGPFFGPKNGVRATVGLGFEFPTSLE